METFLFEIYAVPMRHKHKTTTATREMSSRVPGPPEQKHFAEEQTQDKPPTRLLFTVGPPEVSWSLTKWLALADQALLE